VILLLITLLCHLINPDNIWADEASLITAKIKLRPNSILPSLITAKIKLRPNSILPSLITAKIKLRPNSILPSVSCVNPIADPQFLTHFNSKFPLPQNLSWRLAHPMPAMLYNVISTLRGR
jgi:hypothetical protein